MYFHAGAFLSFVLTIVCWPTSARGRRVAPLIEDDWARRPHRAAECTFGKQIRELGSTWYADLGPPFGIMYCIKCECIPVQKKRRIVARAQCRNIKNDCPKLNCDEPVLLPGRCCKSCPGDFSPDIVQDLPAQLTSEEEERSLKHFGTLLTGRTSQSLRRDDQTPSLLRNIAYSYVATGRFAFNRKNLYYSFYLGVETPRPRNLQFVDDAGRILEEQTIDPIGGTYQNATGKLCGVWRRVPRDYRKLLRDERLHVGLVWESSSGVLTGRLSRYRALATEQMTSLLEPARPEVMEGSGGTAIVSASTASAPSVHVSLVFNGVFLATDVADVAVSIVLEHTEKDYVVLSDEIIVDKPSNELNYGEVRSAISGADLRLLTRGKLRLTITSRTSGGLSLVGVVAPRASCDVYQALLTSEVSSRASGLAWAFLDRQGALRYGVRLLGLQEENPLVTLVDEGGKRRTELEDLTPSLIGGLANGSLERPGPRLLEPLFKGELAVTAASHLGSLLRGRLLQRPVADAKDTTAPVLLRRLTQDAVSPTAVGLVWVAVDLDCALHYELEVTGLSSSTSGSETARTSLRLYLETMPLLAQGAPVSRRLLEEFNGNVLEGSVTGLSPVELLRIESGIGFFELTDNKSTRLLKAPFKTRAPLTCLPHYADNDVASVVAYNLHPPSTADIETGACFHETRFYEEGTQWTASSDPCAMCHCYRGLAQCDPVPCPTLTCPTDKRIEPPVGHCCHVCAGPLANSSDNTSMDQNTTMTTKGCTLAGQFHVAGASWHPYLPPSGFDTCAVCTCDPVSLEVRCPRFECPALDCDEKTAVRPDKKACCRQCPGPLSGSTGAGANGTENVDMLPRDQAATTTTRTTLSATLTTTRRTPEDILSSGGCKYPMGGPYENGREWHPRVHSHGEMKCVKCRCKNGEVRCDRKRCPRSLCNSIAIQLKRGKQVSEPDDCCTAQCRRARRHHRNHHHHPPRHSVAPRELS